MIPLSQIPSFFLAQFHSLVQTLSYNDPTMKPIVSLAILGVVGVFMRQVVKKYPRMLYQFVRNKLIFSVTIIDDADESSINYQRFMRFYEMNRSSRGTRKFKLIVDKMRSVLAADVGTHWFFFSKRYYWFVVREMDSSGSEKIKSKITVYSYGLTIEPLTKLTEAFMLKPYAKLGMYGASNHRTGWTRKSSLEKVTLNDMILDDDLQRAITAKLDWFMNNEKWYQERFLDYKLVILLEGPPGTGKSFLVRAIAHYLNRSLYPLNMSGFDREFVDSASNIPLTGIGLMEDFDDSASMLSRDTDTVLSEKTISVRSKDGIKLSTLLNVLQGINSSKGQVIILTTNHLEVLDPAIYRAGRVDALFHIGPMQNELIHRYMARMYSVDQAARYNHVFQPANASLLSSIFVANPHDIGGFVSALLSKQSGNKVAPISKIHQG